MKLRNKLSSGLEWVVAVPLIVLLAPVIIATLVVFGLPTILISLIRRDPHPKFPDVPKPKGHQDKDLPEVYTQYAQKIIDDVVVTKSDKEGQVTYALQRKGMPEVRYYYWHDGGMFAGIEIDGVDTGYWHTAEEENIDDCFWVSISALKHGFKVRRNRLGWKEAWIKLDDQNAWFVTRTDGEHSYHYRGFRRAFPDVHEARKNV